MRTNLLMLFFEYFTFIYLSRKFKWTGHRVYPVAYAPWWKHETPPSQGNTKYRSHRSNTINFGSTFALSL